MTRIDDLLVAVALGIAVVSAGCRGDRKTVLVQRGGIGVVARLARPSLTLANAGIIPLTYHLSATATQTVDVIVEYTADDGVSTHPATPARTFAGHEGAEGLTAGPTPGVTHTFAWQTLQDVPRDTRVTVTVTPIRNGVLGVPDSVAFVTAAPPDRLEPNDVLVDATGLGALTASSSSVFDLTIGPAVTDRDYFAFTASGDPALVTFRISFAHDLGDLDIVVLDDRLDPVTGSFSVTDDEEVRFLAAAGASLFPRVQGFGTQTNVYSLDLSVVTSSAVTPLLSEGFETPSTTTDLALLASGAWSTTSTSGSAGDWQLGAATSSLPLGGGASRLVGTDLAQLGYATSTRSILRAPAVTIPAGVTRTAVRFLAFIQTEETFDTLAVEADLDGAGFQALGTWSGDQTLLSGFNRLLVEGPAVTAGQTLTIRFVFDSDASVVETGVYLDEIEVLGFD